MYKIILVVKYYYPLKRPSGILRFVMNLSEKLGQKTDLTIITCKFDNKHKNSECFGNYKIIRSGFPFYISSAVKAGKLKPDLIIFGTGIPKTWVLLMTSIIFKCISMALSYVRSFKRPRYFLYQFVDLDYKNHFLVKYICRIFEKVICTNSSLYDFYSKQNNRKENVFYLPPGIDLLKFYNIKSKTNTKIRIGFFGHLSYNKGSDMLLNSFLKLNNSNTELLLAGLGNLEDKLKKRSLEHKNVFIKGYIENIEDAIASCDLLVFPYRRAEMILGLSLSAIEGLAMGKPMIVSNNNCLRDLVEHGENGYIFENEDELFNYLRTLIDDKRLLEKFGIVARKKSKEFDINLICNKLMNLIE